MEAQRYRVVTLIEPEICKKCRFAVEARVRMADGSTHQMTHCRRKDCDNWERRREPYHPISVRDER